MYSAASEVDGETSKETHNATEKKTAVKTNRKHIRNLNLFLLTAFPFSGVATANHCFPF